MSDQPPIIIKKIKKVEGHGHHGGAWKVAYADFVTAMMAFFLLMWLLNSTSEEQKRGLSNYFGPYGNAQGAGGSGGVLGGLSVQSEGMWTDNKTSPTVTAPSVKVEATEEAGPGDDIGGELEEDGTPNDAKDEAKLETEAEKAAGESEKQAKDAIEAFETQAFREAEEALKQAIESIPELKELSKSLIIDNTPEGLRIQIVDQKGLSMFPLGSSQMHEHMKKLLEQIAKVAINLPNKISISGHTDAKPYSNTNAYSNWELSSDRANASRRILLNAGMRPERIYSVVGKAETEPLIASDPQSDQNRRISIVLRKRHLDENKQGIEDKKGSSAPTPMGSPNAALQVPSLKQPINLTPQAQGRQTPQVDPTDHKIMNSVGALLGTDTPATP